MAELTADGLVDLMADLEEMANLPDDVVCEILTAEAEIVASATREEARQLGIGYNDKNNNSRNTSESNTLPGQTNSYATGATADAVAVSKLKKSGGKRWVSVYFKGKRPDGKKASEVAFLNEFGTRTINARNFVWTANEKSGDAAVDAGAKIHDDYLKSKNL